jgi:hypothetical protein
MTELAEPVDIAFVSDEEWECPFSHAKKKPKAIDNVMPPEDGKDTNDSTELGKNLDAEFAGMEVIPIGLKIGTVTKKLDVQFTPHHVIPGNETWPDTKLLQWVDEDKGTINGDIGYDINDASNGIDLPGIHGLGEGGWTGTGPAFQMKYAFAAMASSTPNRQFHDRHNAYSKFVVNVLDAIAAKMEAKGTDAPPGCGNANCGGGKREKPYDPPFGLIARLDGVAGRLKRKLQGDQSGWEMPIFTSRFALMFKTQPMTQEEARAALREAREAMK